MNKFGPRHLRRDALARSNDVDVILANEPHSRWNQARSQSACADCADDPIHNNRGSFKDAFHRHVLQSARRCIESYLSIDDVLGPDEWNPTGTWVGMQRLAVLVPYNRTRDCFEPKVVDGRAAREFALKELWLLRKDGPAKACLRYFAMKHVRRTPACELDNDELHGCLRILKELALRVHT